MAPPLTTSLRNTHLVGTRTREWSVIATQCLAFRPHRLDGIGWSEIRPPYRMVRSPPKVGSNTNCCHVIVSCSGTGRVWADGGWKKLEPDQAYLTPPGRIHAFEPDGKAVWNTAWAIYVHPGQEKPIFDLPDPIVKQVDSKPFLELTRAIHREVHSTADPSMLHHLTEALQLHVLRLRSAEPFDRRIGMLTGMIEGTPSYPWTVKELATRLHISEEHLRRICLKWLDRSPMEHVSCIRIQRACALLHTADLKLQTIAEMVGYANAFSLSIAFKRLTGVSPAHYREYRPDWSPLAMQTPRDEGHQDFGAS